MAKCTTWPGRRNPRDQTPGPPTAQQLARGPGPEAQTPDEKSWLHKAASQEAHLGPSPLSCQQGPPSPRTPPRMPPWTGIRKHTQMDTEVVGQLEGWGTFLALGGQAGSRSWVWGFFPATLGRRKTSAASPIRHHAALRYPAQRIISFQR